MHILVFKLTYLYTLGHEAIHVIATWLCGGHVTSFSVSKWGGNVSTSKTNFFIELSPYFVPIYTVGLLLIVSIIKNKLVDACSFYISPTLELKSSKSSLRGVLFYDCKLL